LSVGAGADIESVGSGLIADAWSVLFGAVERRSTHAEHSGSAFGRAAIVALDGSSFGLDIALPGPLKSRQNNDAEER